LQSIERSNLIISNKSLEKKIYSILETIVNKKKELKGILETS